jgi:UDP-N-acetylglucosamine--N-acetylmuramyl-(pentapeptide) pyrophosphoryl-undecaprenol N-acetylglucosamine transferase
MPRRLNGDFFTLPFRLAKAVRETRKLLTACEADVLVGFGGYVSIPAYLAARKLIPVVVHEANAKAGLANRIGARFAKRVAETVPGSLPNAVLTGLPIRATIRDINRVAMRAEALKYFGVSGDKPIVLCFGGSQGAAKLNAVIAESLERGFFDGVTLIHAVGGKNELPVSENERYKPYAYVDRMDCAYAVADLIISRSGAMTVSEITSVGIPACYVPLPIGNGEQALNAGPVVSAGGALMCEDSALTSDFVRDQIVPLIASPARRKLMAERSKTFGRSDAASRLADLVDSAVQEAGH